MRSLNPAMAGQDIVYANLTGSDIDQQAKRVVDAMIGACVIRLILVASLGVYAEVPREFGEWNRRHIGGYLPLFRRAANAIETSGLDYTILRPAWLTDENEVDYETAERNQAFKGTEVSRKSVADLIVKLIDSPRRSVASNLAVNKPPYRRGQARFSLKLRGLGSAVPAKSRGRCR